jgi:hypothetical protein
MSIEEEIKQINRSIDNGAIWLRFISSEYSLTINNVGAVAFGFSLSFSWDK